MESINHVNVPLRVGKKMKKRKELDALVANSISKRACAGKRCVAGNGISSQDQLLSVSTDEQEEYWMPNKRTAVQRTRLVRRRTCLSLFRACTAILVCACVVATTTVMWLFIDIREQIGSLRNEMDQVSVSSQGVPEALQLCHESTKDLQRNQSMLAGQVADLAAQLANFTQQLTTVQTGLDAVQNRFKTSPELVNVPHQLDQLSKSVVQFGSQIKDISTTVGSLKEQSNKLQDDSNIFKQNLTSIQLYFTNMTRPAMESNKSTEETKVLNNLINQMDSKILDVNKTLTKNLQWIQDEQKEHKITLNQLTEDSANISTRVATLQGSLLRDETEYKRLNGTVNDLMYKIFLTNNTTSILTNQMQNLGSQISLLLNNESEIRKAMKLQNMEFQTTSPYQSPTSKAPVMTIQSPASKSTPNPSDSVSKSSAPVTPSTQATITTTANIKVSDIPVAATGKPIVLSAPAE